MEDGTLHELHLDDHGREQPDKKCHRNAAKAKAKDTTGRFEKTFFGQRRLCALSKGLLASKSMQRCNVPLEQRSGLADISLGHARQKIPPSKDVFTSSFIPSPIHISPCTPRSRSRTKRRLEAHSSSSNTSKSAVLDALNISERQSAFESVYMR